jgi:hypothetical protein
VPVIWLATGWPGADRVLLAALAGVSTTVISEYGGIAWLLVVPRPSCWTGPDHPHQRAQAGQQFLMIADSGTGPVLVPGPAVPTLATCALPSHARARLRCSPPSCPAWHRWSSRR